MLNAMCYDCKSLYNGCNGSNNQVWNGCVYKEKDESKKGMVYFQRNNLWNANSKIHAKFGRLSSTTGNFIYVGLLANSEDYTIQDYIDIMSYYSCVGLMEISEEEAKKVSNLPTGNYVKFLKLEKAPRAAAV